VGGFFICAAFFCERAYGMMPIGSPGRIEMLNGVPIYFEVHGSGEPLLLLHGFSGGSQDWIAFVAMQAQSARGEFQLIIPDMRGHGRSFAAREVAVLARKAHGHPSTLLGTRERVCHLSFPHGGMTKRQRTCLRCSTIWELRRLRALA
jgi:hypothetical protein